MTLQDWQQVVVDSLSVQYFGTADYQSVLQLLSPADASVKQFKHAYLTELGEPWQ